MADYTCDLCQEPACDQCGVHPDPRTPGLFQGLCRHCWADQYEDNPPRCAACQGTIIVSDRGEKICACNSRGDCDD